MRTRIVLALALAASLLGLAGLRTPADAAGVRVCAGAGDLYFDRAPDGSASITVTGGGSCPIALGTGGKVVTITGTGHAASLGLCSGELLARGMVVDITVVATNPATGASTTEHYTWSSVVTTYPLITPLVITGDGLGASITLNHIWLNCGQDGTRPHANFIWAQTV